MYVPGPFTVSTDVAWQIVQDQGAGFLVVGSRSGLKSVFVPVIVDRERGELRAHVARANSWWSSARDGDEVNVLFSAASAYISPNLYPTKQTNPAVVPTWDYVVASVDGHVTIRDDVEWKRALVREMTDRFEISQPGPWSIDDAPAQHIEKRLTAIVGVQITVSTISASAKLSQNQPDVNQESIRGQFAHGSEREKNISEWMGRES